MKRKDYDFNLTIKIDSFNYLKKKIVDIYIPYR